MTVLSALLLAAAVLVLAGSAAPARLSRLVGLGRPSGSPAWRPVESLAASRGGAARPARVRVACVAAGFTVAWLVTGTAGVVLGSFVATAGPALLARLEPADPDAELLTTQLPLALELLAACLAGGAEIGRAVAAVAEAAPEPVAARLRRVGGLLSLGAPPPEAWGALAAGDGPAAAAGRALVRSAEGGAPVADAVRAVAASARRDEQGRARARARRAGVLAVGPLGLCFLPAFVLAGVVPAVLGLAGPLLTSLR